MIMFVRANFKPQTLKVTIDYEYHVISNTTQYMCTSKVLVMKSYPDQETEAVFDFSQNLNTVLLSCD